jgi:hypothetical protein
MSSTAIIWRRVSGLTARASVSSFNVPGASRFSMKKTGRSTTYDGNFKSRTTSSMRHLFSKCGMPVFLCAEPTDE